jgi:ribonuclease HI
MTNNSSKNSDKIEDFVFYLGQNGINVSDHYNNFINKVEPIQKESYISEIEIYTDGAVLDNKNSKKINLKGGIGIWSDQINLSIAETYENATNNKMELQAIFRALQIVSQKNISSKIVIFSDSVYSIKCITLWYKKWETNGWKTYGNKDVENQDVIKNILELKEKLPNVRIQYVKAHSGVVGNERADQLAGSVFRQ